MGDTDAADPRPTRRSRSPKEGLKRFSLRLVLFCLAYLSVRSFIELATPFQTGSDHLSSKLAILEREKEPPSVFFIGSSRTHYHFNPALFDSLVSSGGGGPVRSFNLSQGFATDYESVYIARNMLKSGRAPACRTVYIEINFRKPELEWEGDGNSDERHYHRMDPSMFVFHAGAVLRAEGWDFFRKARALYALAQVIGSKYLGVGRYRNLLMGTNTYRAMEPTEIRGRGFESMDSQYARLPPDELRRIRESLDTARFRMKIQETADERRRLDTSSHDVLDAFFHEFVREAARMGVKVVYTYQPNFNTVSSPVKVPSSLSDRVIDFTDPDLFPELYDMGLYYDMWHLNTKGSDVVTTRLAEIHLSRTGASQPDGNASSTR